MDVSAPGVGVFSTEVPMAIAIYPIRVLLQVQAFASPNTAGVLALVLQRFPNLTIGQAMQQVRVTEDSLLGLDPSRNYYEGHGEVDAFRAVTDTNTYAARVDSFTIVDKNGTGSFALTTGRPAALSFVFDGIISCRFSSLPRGLKL